MARNDSAATDRRVSDATRCSADARTPALWHVECRRLPPDSLSNEHDPRNRASIFALAVGPTFLACLCDTFWGADGHLAALLGACSYGLAANRTSVFITGAPGSGKTRSCAFLGVLVACLTSRLTLYTAHGNESVRAYVETVDRLTSASNDFVRNRITRIPGNKEKDTYKLPFDAHDVYRGLLVATTHGTIVARLSFPYSLLINRLKDVELLLRDEAQQLGTPGSNTILTHIKHALDVMIGDHRQPAGGSRPNYHYVTELLEQKTCGLNAVPADLYTPATLPAALLRQTAKNAGPWKKGQCEMPSWGKPNLGSGFSDVLFSPVSMLESILCMSIVKPKQAETVMQAAGLKAIVGPAVNLSLCSSMRLPPEIAAILYACRYSEACLFELIGRADEAQQLGTPGSNTILTHIKHALDVMIGDHRQPAGGSRPNYHYVTELLEQKTCGLNAVPADPYTPATLPAALLRQTAKNAGPWKKGQCEMPSWGKPNLGSGFSDVLFSPVSMLESILCMSIVKPKQAETVMQAAGLKAIVGPAVNLSLCSSMRLPPEIAAILYACRYSEACLFELIGRAPTFACRQVPRCSICSGGLCVALLAGGWRPVDGYGCLPRMRPKPS